MDSFPVTGRWKRKRYRGLFDCTGEGELMEACAVLEEREEVGGPEENIDLLGVLKREGWFVGGG